MTEQQAPDRTTDYQGKTERITHPPQIAALLRRVRDQKVLLSAQVPGHEGLFNSMLLDVNPERNIILLDELSPRGGHELACQVRQLRVRCQCHGVELSFACAIEVGQSQRGISFYRASLPDAINYLQRRINFRVRVGVNLAVPVHLPLEGAAILDGELSDLSLGGLGANVSTHVKLSRGQIIDTCSIHLPKGESLQAELEIRFVRHDTQRQQQHIGAAFRNLQPQQEQTLRKFVAQLEREMLRRKARS
ncbi:MAG: flagellar brake protein [Gammaproteobacteria bacterium]|nr:flagellar brake protein [Gammaproteobacteria bacterium]